MVHHIIEFLICKRKFCSFSSKRTTLLENFDTHYYYGTPSSIRYYADAYRFDPGYYYSSSFENGITGIGKTAAGSENHLLYESQGYHPASASRFLIANIMKVEEVQPYFQRFLV